MNAKKNSDATDVEAYLAAVPEPARSSLDKVRAIIRAAAPAESTEYISYGMPAFKYKGPLFGYAAFKLHCSLFPMSGALIAKMHAELAQYETAKGTIRFPSNKPPPAALIRKMVKLRVAQNEAKEAAKKRASAAR